MLARNRSGADTRDYADNGTSGTSEESFIDPYNPTARADYLQMVRAVLARNPDAALYDYVRYPRLTGAASVASEVSNLWIYGPAANQALIQRATNNKGRALIQRFSTKRLYYRHGCRPGRCSISDRRRTDVAKSATRLLLHLKI